MIETIFAYLPANTFSLILLAVVGLLGYSFLFAIKKTQWVIYFLLVWLPFESLILRYTPIDYYSYVRFFPEMFLYGFLAITFLVYIKNTGRLFPKSPINYWLFAYLAVALISLIVNQYSPVVWALGLRQLLRFATVFFIILFHNYDKKTMQHLLYVGGVVMLLQALLGLLQFIVGGRLDPYLFSSITVNVGNSAVLGGIEQFWTPGTRVFATMGRYDRLGSFLALGLAMLFPYIYFMRTAAQRFWYWLFGGIGLLALFLTVSRASWIAAVVAICVSGIFVMKDKRVVATIVAFILFVSTYVTGFVLVNENISSITETPNISVAERIIESFSLRAWRESYDGYGRIFFIINTPRMVVATSPFVGVGPGNYGGGVAAALVNTDAYDRLKLPFGIQNLYGQIDNSWMSIWGEVGTLGLISYLGIFASLIYMCRFVMSRYKEKDPFPYFLSIGFIGAVAALMVLAFFGPYLEFRSLLFYFWVIAGTIALYWRDEKKRGDLFGKKWI